MDACEDLERATALLRSTICNFSIGAVTLNDFKPIEEKINDTRTLIKCLNSRILLLRTVNEKDRTVNLSPENPNELENKLQLVISNHVYKYKTLKNILQSLAVENILNSDTLNSSEMSSKLQAVMNKLYNQNDKIITLQGKVDELYRKEKDLQANVASSIVEYQHFLKEQEKSRNQRLAELNPEIAGKRERLKKLITKINISKRVVTNLISAASFNIIDKPEFLRTLKEHRDLVNTETIMEMVQHREF